MSSISCLKSLHEIHYDVPPGEPVEEEILSQRFKPLSKDEFKKLLYAHLDPLFGLAVSLTRNKADAEDLVQEASLKAYRSREQFEPGTKIKDFKVSAIQMDSHPGSGRNRTRSFAQITQARRAICQVLRSKGRSTLPSCPSFICRGCGCNRFQDGSPSGSRTP